MIRSLMARYRTAVAEMHRRKPAADPQHPAAHHRKAPAAERWRRGEEHLGPREPLRPAVGYLGRIIEYP
jgi:hypothetical protein